MQAQQKHTLQMFRRVRDFLARNAVSLPLAKVGVQADALSAVVDRLTVFSVEQDTRSRLTKSGTSSLSRQVREVRQSYMLPLSSFARTLAEPDVGFRRALTIRRQTDVEGTIAAALGMADAAETRKDAFIAGGFEPDFAEQLRAVARELKATLDDRAKDRGRRSASTAGVKEEVRQGRTLIHLLSAIVTPALAASPSLLAEWRTLKKQVRPATLTVASGGIAGTPSTPSTPSTSTTTPTAEVKAA